MFREGEVVRIRETGEVGQVETVRWQQGQDPMPVGPQYVVELRDEPSLVSVSEEEIELVTLADEQLAEPAR